MGTLLPIVQRYYKLRLNSFPSLNRIDLRHRNVPVPLRDVPCLVPVPLGQPGKGAITKLTREGILLSPLMQLFVFFQKLPSAAGEPFPANGAPQRILLTVGELVSAFVGQLRESPGAVTAGVGLLFGVHPKVVLQHVLPLEAA